MLQCAHIAEAFTGFRIGHLIKAHAATEFFDRLALLLAHSLLKFREHVAQSLRAIAQYRWCWGDVRLF